MTIYSFYSIDNGIWWVRGLKFYDSIEFKGLNCFSIRGISPRDRTGYLREGSYVYSDDPKRSITFSGQIDGHDESFIVSGQDLKGFKMWSVAEPDETVALYKKGSDDANVRVGRMTSSTFEIQCAGIDSLCLVDELRENLKSPVRLFVEEWNKEVENEKKLAHYNEMLNLQELDLKKRELSDAKIFCESLCRLVKQFVKIGIMIDFPRYFAYSRDYTGNLPSVESAIWMLKGHLDKIASSKVEITKCLEARNFLDSKPFESLFGQFKIKNPDTIDPRSLKRFRQSARKLKISKVEMTSKMIDYDFATFRKEAPEDVRASFANHYDEVEEKMEKSENLLRNDGLDKRKKVLESLESLTSIHHKYVKFVRNLSVFSKDSSGKLLMIPEEKDRFLISMEESFEESVVAGGEGDEGFVKVAGGGGGEEVVIP